ncbi:MAG: SCO family protein [Dechloromonas sp.]|nr:SCO family protein [Dechloromonas sp.]
MATRQNRRPGHSALAALLFAGLLPWGGVQAHQGSHAPSAASPEPVAAPLSPGTRDARSYFTDTELLTQDGRSVRFYSDVLADKVVLINVVFTNCEDACPLITHKLMDVRKRLTDAGQDVWFVSISNDPERDSPQALKKFAAEQGVDEARWIFLTGGKEAIGTVLGRLGQMSRTVEEHSTLLIAGNVAAKRWSKIRPDAPVPAIAERLRALVGAP